MRLCDALAYAEGRYRQKEWSPRIRWRAGILDLAHPEVGIGQVFDILENPRWTGVEGIKAAIKATAANYQDRRQARRAKAIKEWRDKMAMFAVEGRREAFMFIKQADLPTDDESAHKSVRQVIEENTELWGKL